MLLMKKLGLNRCKYRIEENFEMHDAVIDMVKKDTICQWLLGEDLKKDQLVFMYDVICILYDSPCRDLLLGLDKEFLETTLPMLVAYRTIFHMKDWLNNKETYETKMKKLEEPVYNEPTEAAPKGAEAPVPKPIDLEEEARQFAADEEMFGRYWIWENYFPDNKRNLW
jgi:hypothetical protein